MFVWCTPVCDIVISLSTKEQLPRLESASWFQNLNLGMKDKTLALSTFKLEPPGFFLLEHRVSPTYRARAQIFVEKLKNSFFYGPPVEVKAAVRA